MNGSSVSVCQWNGLDRIIFWVNGMVLMAAETILTYRPHGTFLWKFKSSRTLDTANRVSHSVSPCFSRVEF